MIIYDLETIRPVAPTDPTDRIPGIEYAQDWRDFAGMGVACAATYNYIDARYEHYILDPTVPGSEKAKMQLLDNFQHYGWLPFTTVGYNNCAFDARLLRDSANIVIPTQASWDLLQELWASAGLGPEYRLETHTGFSLDAVALANGIPGKIRPGEQAPVLWQQGERQEVLKYCENDVRILKGLIDIVLKDGALNDPRKPSRKLHIRDEPLARLRAAHFAAMNRRK